MMNAIIIAETYLLVFLMISMSILLYLSNRQKLSFYLVVFVDCLTLTALWIMLTEMALSAEVYPFIADRNLRALVARGLWSVGAGVFLYGLVFGRRN